MAGDGDGKQVRDLQRRAVDLSIEMVALLHKEGAPLLLGTDAGSPLTPQGFTVADELEYFSQSGLSGFDVLSTATTAVARYLGRDDAGTVEVGKRADVLLVDSDPLVDPGAAARRIAAVFSNGFVFDRAELDRLLAWREATAEATVDLPETELGPMANKTWWAR
jgi:imidazolonepropionase-like amidohydrolase